MPRRSLTDREQRVVRLVAKGLGNREITDALQITLPATKRCISHIMLKWDCTNRTQIAVEALRRGVASLQAEPIADLDPIGVAYPDVVGGAGHSRAPSSAA